MTKADKMFNELGMKKKEVKQYTNGELTEHTQTFSLKHHDADIGSSEYSTKFDLINHRIHRVRIWGMLHIDEILILPCEYEKMKELGWLDDTK